MIHRNRPVPSENPLLSSVKSVYCIMTRSRHQKEKNLHYVLLVNPTATNHQPKAIDKLTRAIKRRGGYYTVVEPNSAAELLRQAQQVKQLASSGAGATVVSRRGEVTALIACGGDGTFNLTARGALANDLPVGYLPLGRFNNIARHLYGDNDTDTAVAKIIKGDYKKFDVGTVADQQFFGAVGLGFLPELTNLLADKRTPRFGIGWSQLAAKAAANVALHKTIIKVDVFRFEVTPIFLSVNLLPYAAGLPFSTASLIDDTQAEVIFDVRASMGDFSSFVRSIYKKKYLYGREIRMFRGRVMTIQSTKGRTLYLDGELIHLPTNALTITIGEQQVKIFC